MRYQVLLNKKATELSWKQLILPVVIVFTSIILTVAGQVKFFTGSLKVFFESGIIMVGLIYLLRFLILFPVLVTIRFVRSKSKGSYILLSSILIILWSFLPLALIWSGMSIISIVITPIQWNIFYKTYLWMNALVFPISVFYFYWKYTESNLIDSLIDAMILSGIELILNFL
ncbi:MAG: hypothetical protein PWQ59_1786 [Thermoanaerobacterium sp.]|jgi:hypothetical protein|nr:hypothetical protein [Fusobacteriales bacterium]MDI3478261.1 hypothetical protein [Thermoanaerobacterium sp.]MDK2815102.1 hypothetical protein [Thermoanaerobacter sp.]